MSICESFGFAIAEAMAAGLPVVGTRSCAIPFLVEHGRTGLLVDPTLTEDGEAHEVRGVSYSSLPCYFETPVLFVVLYRVLRYCANTTQHDMVHAP